MNKSKSRVSPRRIASMSRQVPQKGKRPTHNLHGKSSNRVSLGLHAVKEALKVRPQEIVKIALKSNWESVQELQEVASWAKRKNITIEVKRVEELDRIGSHHQGVMAEIKNFKEISLDQIGSSTHSTLMILDGIEDPHNLGAILRTSWLMGVEAIILPTDRAVGLTPTVHKVSCGGVEHVPVLKVVNLSQAIEQLKEKGYWIYGLSAQGNKTLNQLNIAEKVAWVLGAEDKGLRTTTEKKCDELVLIPQLDNAASYNVSVAAGITLYETCRQLKK